MQNLLLKCFPELLAEEVNYVLNNFHNNHDEIVKNIKIPPNGNWETAWNNVEINSFILSSIDNTSYGIVFLPCRYVVNGYN